MNLSTITISTIFTATICLVVSIILLKNNSRSALKPLAYLTLYFFFVRFISLGNIYINESIFYNLLNIKFLNFYKEFVVGSAIVFPALCLMFFVNNKNRNFLFLYSFFSGTILVLMFSNNFLLTKVSYSLYASFAFILSIYYLLKNKKMYKDFHAYKFLMSLNLISLLVTLTGTIYYISNNLMFNEERYIINNFFYHTDYKVFAQLGINVLLAFFSLYIMFTPRLIYGAYYFNPLSDKFLNNRNHWSNVPFKKIDKKDVKLFETIKTKIPIIVSELIHIEGKYISNNVMFYNKEEVSQLINHKLIETEFIFKYHNNLTFNKFMIKINMLKAHNLILNGFLKSNSVTDLAKVFGYKSRAAFFTKFKEITGSSPTNVQ